jgi:deazaflavin-dependent oxidoreductase (nitroreductase family)
MPLKGEYAPSSSDWAREQAETYEATGGAEQGDLRGMPVIVLTSLGAKSGKLRKNPLMRVEHAGEYAVIASKGGAPENPTWYYNLVNEPHVELQVGPGRRGLPGLRRLRRQDRPRDPGVRAHRAGRLAQPAACRSSPGNGCRPGRVEQPWVLLQVRGARV